MKNELEPRGFVISQRIEDADAIMNIEILAIANLDGDGTEKDKAIYHFELDLPNKQQLWKCEIKFPRQDSRAKEDEEAARRLAGKLEKKVRRKSSSS